MPHTYTDTKPPTFREAQKQITLIFTLSMPNPPSWNGKWSGEEKINALIRPLPRNIKSIAKADELLKAGRWAYHWGDGWTAIIDVRRGDTEDVRQTRKKSSGFCGYDWMVANILDHGSPYPK